MTDPSRAIARVVAALVLLCSVATAPAADEAPRCYKLVKIDTYADYVNSPDINLRNDATGWAADHTVTTAADGTMVIGKKSRASHTWQVDPNKGTAVATDTGTDPPSRIDATWTVPPATWCENQDYAFSMTSKAVGPIWGGPGLDNWPYETFDNAPGTVAQGTDPWRGVYAGQWSGGVSPSAAGSVAIHPKVNKGDSIILMIRLVSVDKNWIFYHYERDPNGKPGPLKPPTPPTGAAAGCPKTFAQDWPNTTWGRMPIQITGDRATGTYANRESKYGPGTFSGTVAGNTLTADWKDAAGEGTFVLTLSSDGCSFTSTNTMKPPATGTGGGPTGQQPSPGGTTGGGGTTGTTGGGTGGTGTGTGGGSGGTAGSGDPCTDPAAQQCIQKWLDKAMEIRNRRDTSNPAPGGRWRVGNYGALLGHNVIAEQPPEGWETKYHSNKYCVVWLTWQQSHTLAAYGGELEPLADFVKACTASMKPPIPPPPPLGGTTGGGTGTGSGGGATGGAGGTPVGSAAGNPDVPAVSKMTLVAFKRKVQAGETVQVPIWLLKASDVANVNFTIAYDASVAVAEGPLTGGYLLDGSLFDSNAKTAGSIKAGFARTSGVSGDGPVAYASFKAVGKPGDKTALTLAVTTINNPGGAALPIDLIHGEIQIVGPGGVLPGDCDGDGVLTAADAWCALQMSVGNMPVKLALDLDTDSNVTSRDSTLILQKAVGK